MNGFDDFTHARAAVRAAGCRLIGCLALALALTATICALATFGALMLVRSARAVSPPQHYLLFVDQSGSVAAYTPTQTLARDVTLAFVQGLRAASPPESTLELIFFGGQPRQVISPTVLSDERLDARIRQAFARSGSLGGTRFDLAFALALERGRAGDVVVIISDGVPETGAPLAGHARQAHIATLEGQAEALAARPMTVFFCALGREMPDWASLWSRLTDRTGGAAFALRNAADAQRAGEAIALARPRLVTQATATPLPSATPLPAATLEPTITPVISATPSPVLAAAPVVVPPATTAPAAPFDPSALALVCLAGLGGACALVVAFSLGFLSVALRSLGTRHAAAAIPAPADEGCLEIYDPETDAVRRIELRSHAVGEVLTLGRTPDCTIRLDVDAGDAGGCGLDPIEPEAQPVTAVPERVACDAAPMAALVLAPDGPRLESRGAPLYFDGRSVRRHLLFDNDVLYLDRFVLYYHNFFRQRAVDESDEL